MRPVRPTLLTDKDIIICFGVISIGTCLTGLFDEHALRDFGWRPNTRFNYAAEATEGFFRLRNFPYDAITNSMYC